MLTNSTTNAGGGKEAPMAYIVRTVTGDKDRGYAVRDSDQQPSRRAAFQLASEERSAVAKSGPRRGINQVPIRRLSDSGHRIYVVGP